MRADRLLSIMMLLQMGGRMTARDLATRLEVSERTIHRDMEALSSAGVPVYALRGVGGGWGLVDEYRTDLTGLSRSEIMALFLSTPSELLSDLGLKKASDAAFRKMLASMPAGQRRVDAEYVRQRIHVESAGWNSTDESVPLIPIIQEAVWRERKMRFMYRRPGCEPAEREVDPLGLVAKGSAWYLVAGVGGDLRSYRVSRILDVEILEEGCIRPAGFDLARFWRQRSLEFKESLPVYVVRVRASSRILPRMNFSGRFARVQRIGPLDDEGWAEVVIRFDVEEVAREYVLGFGANVDVLDPPELRERVLEDAKEVVRSIQQRWPGRSAAGETS